MLLIIRSFPHFFVDIVENYAQHVEIKHILVLGHKLECLSFFLGLDYHHHPKSNEHILDHLFRV